MENHDTLVELIDKMLTVVQAPIAHSYGYAELLKHDLENSDEIDLKQIKGDLNKIMVNLSRVLVYLEDFSNEYDNLK